MVVSPLIVAADPASESTSLGFAALAAITAIIAREREPEAVLDAALHHVVDALGARAGRANVTIGEGHAVTAMVGAAAPPAVADTVRIRAAGETIGEMTIAEARGGHGATRRDLAFLEAAATLTGMAASRAALGRALSASAGTTRDLDLAASIQERLLPRVDPALSPVQGLNRPIRKVSGDFYDYLKLPDGRFAFALGDVSGKGIKAALMMSRAASLFRCLVKSIPDPADLLRALNAEILDASTQGMFVTMVAGLYDPASGRAIFANAGHEPPLLRHADRSYASFEAEAPPLGIVADIAPKVEDVLVAGGELYMYSDGLTEFAYGDDEMLGVTGLIQMVEVSTDTPLAERLSALLAELEDDGWEARDDLTVLTIDGNWIRRHD